MIGQEILGNRGRKKVLNLQDSREDKRGTLSHSLQKTSNPIMNNEL